MFNATLGSLSGGTLGQCLINVWECMCAWDVSLKPRLSIPNFSHSSGERCQKIIGKAWVEASGMYIDHSSEQLQLLFIMQDMYAV